MDAITLIQNNLNIDKLLKYYDFDKVHNDGEIIRACCKLHGGNNPSAFVIKRETGLWYCHTGGCGGGDVFSLVQKMEDTDFYSAVRRLANLFDVDIRKLRITEKKSRHMDDLQKFIKLMVSKRKKTIPTFTIDEEVKEVVKYRNFHEETLRHFGVGHVTSITLTKRNGEEYRLHNRLIFPLIIEDVQVGVSLKRIKSADYPKWSHQPAHINTRDILYNYNSVKYLPTVTVCEGIDDVMAFYEIGVPAVCTFGSHISKEQYKLLLKTGADIVLAFDGDAAGRTATDKAIKMFKYKANIFVISFADREDPESIGREELKKKYENKRKKV